MRDGPGPLAESGRGASHTDRGLGCRDEEKGKSASAR